MCYYVISNMRTHLHAKHALFFFRQTHIYLNLCLADAIHNV